LRRLVNADDSLRYSLVPRESVPYCVVSTTGTKVGVVGEIDLLVQSRQPGGSRPSRRTIGMFYEMLVAKACAKNGTHTDGTIFKNFDQEVVAADLEAMGVQKYGYERLINGMTGEYIDALIFKGPIYYQRLQKFVVDVVYSIAQGPSDAITFQPLDQLRSKWGLITLLVYVW
jgi:hypothetical protein